MKKDYSFSILILLASFIICTSSVLVLDQKSTKSIGDKLQYVNFAVGTIAALKYNKISTLTIIYAEGVTLVHGIKFMGSVAKWEVCKRPDSEGKRSRFDGLPSGHTAFAWFAASFFRLFSNNYYISLPLYISSIFTGFTRVYSGEHSFLQVFFGALFAEVLVITNQRFLIDFNDKLTKKAKLIFFQVYSKIFAG
ncbi:MAG: phosphatase PAP2 family protein [Rickettsiaceae bacterium]|nr:phosphatase PAP2 family protein [Rickettsiaceae bacterium]